MADLPSPSQPPGLPEWKYHPEVIPMPPDPPEPPEPSRWRKLLGPLGLLGMLLLKFGAKLKFALVPLMKFLPIVLKSGGTMIFTVAAYSMFWGWKYALGFVLLILVHELGHVVAARRFGIPVEAPMFIPFFGAFVLMREAPSNAYVQAEIGIAGPIWGSVAAGVCHWAGLTWDVPLLLALAWTGYFLNLFNLMPVGMLDGGSIVQAISPWLHLLGFVAMLWVAVNYPSFIVFLILALSIPQLLKLFYTRSAEEESYYSVTPWQRVRVSLGYFALILILVWQMHVVHGQMGDFRAAQNMAQ